MYHSLSSLFNFNSISDEKNQKDSTYNYSVFDEEGEAIDDKSKLTQYILEKEHYIGIDNSSSHKLKVNERPYKGQTLPIFELNANKRKVFDVLIISNDLKCQKRKKKI